MSGPVAVLDACVLVPIRLATTLLWLAESGLFQPLWSQRILDEVERNLPNVGVSTVKAHHRVATMHNAFGDEAMVDDFDHLIATMACHPKDRHVLAAAVRGSASDLVTFNIKDFPQEVATLHGIEIVHPDDFLTRLLIAHPEAVTTTLEREAAALHNPPQRASEFVTTLGTTVPGFAHRAAALLPPTQ